MSKLYSSEHIITILVKNGFVFKSSKGSHHKYMKGNRIVIIPHPRKEIPMGTFLSIVRQAGLKKEDFLK